MNGIIQNPHALMDASLGAGTMARPTALTFEAMRDADAVFAAIKEDADVARELGDERLIEVTSRRLDVATKAKVTLDEAIAALHAGEQAYAPAYEALCAAEALREAGSLDPDDALKLAREHEIAAAAERVYRRRLPALKSAAVSALSRLQKLRTDDDARRRREQVQNSESLALRLFNRHQAIGEITESARKIGEDLKAADVVWTVLADELARREFKRRCAERRRGDEVPTEADCDRVFAARDGGYRVACAAARERLTKMEGA